jgi:hypothetical protein
VLQRVAKLQGCRLLAADGDIGTVEEMYFDDARWVVRYLVVATGGWLSGRDVLISPYAVQTMDLQARTVAVNLTRERVRRSPDVDTAQPVSRQYETAYSQYYGYPTYWPYNTYWPAGSLPTLTPMPDRLSPPTAESSPSDPDSHLRSSSEVTGYRIRATDDLLGHLEDFLFDDETWAIRYIVIDTRNWLPGRRVLLPTDAIREVDWLHGSVHVDRTREAIKEAPEFDPDHLPAGDLERRLRSPTSRST